MCEYKTPRLHPEYAQYSLLMSMGCLYFRTFTLVENEDSSIVRTIERYRYERVHDVINDSPRSGECPEPSDWPGVINRRLLLVSIEG